MPKYYGNGSCNKVKVHFLVNKGTAYYQKAKAPECEDKWICIGTPLPLPLPLPEKLLVAGAAGELEAACFVLV